jgi:hypothetical protein
VEQLFADQQAGHGAAGKGLLVPGQQVLGGPPSGGVEEGTDAELELNAELVAVPFRHLGQAATEATGPIGRVDRITLLHAPGVLGVVLGAEDQVGRGFSHGPLRS